MTLLLAELLEPEMRHLAERVTALPDDSIWVQLPKMCWHAAGGDSTGGDIAMLAFLTGTLGLKTLDDVQDEHIHPSRSNEGVTLVLQVFEILEHLPDTTPASIMQVQRHYTRTLLQMGAGQHLDLCADLSTESPLEQSWHIAGQKTGVWFGWGASLYPQVAGDTAADQQLRQFGTHLGLMHQLANDVRGFRDISDQGDLKAGKLSIPVAYMKSVPNSPENASELDALLHKARTDAEIRQKVIELAVENRLDRYVRVMAAYHAKQACQAVHERFPELTRLVEHPSVALHLTYN